ncbi:MAG: hypothetical protein JWR55_81 [Aeromicrobium sp.]|nr:hypothetical protein [Aeromicrobium sp.]
MVDERDSGKGRPTPSRNEALAARKKQMRVPITRKEQAKRERAAREDIRLKQRDALKNGDERYLPARDQGPVRRFTRDFVDRRRNFAEFLLPALVVLLVLFAVANNLGSTAETALTSVVYPFLILGTVLDEVIMVRGLKKQLAARFGADAVKGQTSYAVLRSTQLRRFRLPKVQVKRGQKLDGTYR